MTKPELKKQIEKAFKEEMDGYRFYSLLMSKIESSFRPSTKVGKRLTAQDVHVVLLRIRKDELRHSELLEDILEDMDG